jgi:hypothetical protein
MCLIFTIIAVVLEAEGLTKTEIEMLESQEIDMKDVMTTVAAIDVVTDVTIDATTEEVRTSQF